MACHSQIVSIHLQSSFRAGHSDWEALWTPTPCTIVERRNGSLKDTAETTRHYWNSRVDLILQIGLTLKKKNRWCHLPNNLSIQNYNLTQHYNINSTTSILPHPTILQTIYILVTAPSASPKTSCRALLKCAQATSALYSMHWSNSKKKVWIKKEKS